MPEICIHISEIIKILFIIYLDKQIEFKIQRNEKN